MCTKLGLRARKKKMNQLVLTARERLPDCIFEPSPTHEKVLWVHRWENLNTVATLTRGSFSEWWVQHRAYGMPAGEPVGPFPFDEALIYLRLHLAKA